jgi:hypothetical protein
LLIPKAIVIIATISREMNSSPDIRRISKKERLQMRAKRRMKLNYENFACSNLQNTQL